MKYPTIYNHITSGRVGYWTRRQKKPCAPDTADNVEDDKIEDPEDEYEDEVGEAYTLAYEMEPEEDDIQEDFSANKSYAQLPCLKRSDWKML